MNRQLLGILSLCCLLVLLNYAAADQSERSDNAETVVASQLRGTWVAVSMERGGRKEEAPKGRELTFTFEVTKVMIKDGNRLEEWSYQNRDVKTLKEIDLTPIKGQPPGIAIKGIYRIDGDTLKFAFSAGGARPTGFDGKDQGDSGVITFKRKK